MRWRGCLIRLGEPTTDGRLIHRVELPGEGEKRPKLWDDTGEWRRSMRLWQHGNEIWGEGPAPERDDWRPTADIEGVCVRDNGLNVWLSARVTGARISPADQQAWPGMGFLCGLDVDIAEEIDSMLEVESDRITPDTLPIAEAVVIALMRETGSDYLDSLAPFQAGRAIARLFENIPGIPNGYRLREASPDGE